MVPQRQCVHAVGFLERGEKTCEWTTYDNIVDVYKVTGMKPKAPKS
jgi:hypothetical protein